MYVETAPRIPAAVAGPIRGKAPPKGKQYTAWAFTINNPTRPVDSDLDMKKVRYMCYQVEEGENKTLHYQGCIKFFTVMRMAQVAKIPGFERAHLEPAKNWEKLKEYCQKEESRVDGPFIFGKDVARGQRTDLEGAIELLKTGGIAAVADAMPEQIVKHGKGLATLKGIWDFPRTRDNMKVIVLVGDTGTGKSHFVHTHFPDVYAVADLEKQWFDGYLGQKVALIDEIGPDNCGPINFMKRLADKWPMRVAVKGGFVSWQVETLFITSNTVPDQWWPKATGLDHAALARRIKVIHTLAGTDWIKDAEAAAQWIPEEIPADDPAEVADQDSGEDGEQRKRGRDEDEESEMDL